MGCRGCAVTGQWEQKSRMDPKPRKEGTLTPLVRTFDAHRDATECITHLFYLFIYFYIPFAIVLPVDFDWD